MRPARSQPVVDTKRLHVIQGEQTVTRDPDVTLSTILGSCVAACLRDEQSGIGGMNHFLLPDGAGRGDNSSSSRYGAHAMELLINEILKQGGRRENLTAKVFGGARMFNDLKSIGDMNSVFVEKFLKNEGIPIISQSLGGRSARRVIYWPATGKVFVREVENQAAVVAERKVAPKPKAPEGSVELF